MPLSVEGMERIDSYLIWGLKKRPPAAAPATLLPERSHHIPSGSFPGANVVGGNWLLSLPLYVAAAPGAQPHHYATASTQHLP